MSETQDWRARRWEETHQRIYATAMDLFVEHGFEQVNVGRIAAGASVSVPTFYAHYPSKEHLVMQLPTAEDMNALLSTQPPDIPVAERMRRAAPAWFAGWDADYREVQLVRWKVIATTPSLRTRAAEFERATAGMLADAVPGQPRGKVSPADEIVINAYMSAFTMGMLAWADGNGERKIEEVVEEAFDALERN